MKRFLVLLLISIVVCSAFGVTWTWQSPYENTYSFRYQLNGEEDDLWIYVDASVTEATIEDAHPGDVLYVQLSLDGEKWSPSGIAEYVESDGRLSSPIPSPGIAQELPMEDDEELLIPVMRRPSIVGVTNERLNRTFEFAFDLDIGTDLHYKDTLELSPYAGIVLDFKNIYSPSYWFGIGVRSRGGVNFLANDGKVVNILQSGNFSLSGYFDIAFAMSFIVVDSVDLTLDLGLGATLNNRGVPALFNISDMGFGTYLNAGLSLDRYFGRSFHIGLSYYLKYFISNSFQNSQFVHNVGLHLGATF